MKLYKIASKMFAIFCSFCLSENSRVPAVNLKTITRHNILCRRGIFAQLLSNFTKSKKQQKERAKNDLD